MAAISGVFSVASLPPPSSGVGALKTWDGATLFDAALGFNITDMVLLTVGGNNIFDTYPDKWDAVNAFPFPQLGFVYGWETLPFGINGSYFYAKVDYRF